MKDVDLNELSNLHISWRQWGVGVEKLQGTPFSEVSFGFGKSKAPVMEAMMEDEMIASDQDPSTSGSLYKKDFTWQNREFDFSEE